MLALKKDPYYYFFPMGLLSAGLGVIIWIAYQLNYLQFYPRNSHAALMFLSFLGAFILGFLMTAIPKMTKTDPAGTLEIILPLLLFPLEWLAAFTGHVSLVFAIHSLQLLGLLVFIGRRFLVKKQIPFEGFVFVPFAFFMAFAGLGYYFLAAEPDLALVYKFCGEAFVLNLICGLGSRLIPVISRLPMALNPDEQGDKSRMLKFAVAALLLNTSFALDFFATSLAANSTRALFITVFAVYFFKILQKPSVNTFVGWSLKIATACLVAGYWLAVINYQNALPSLHVAYIGGLSLLTLMVATRVSLAHGGKSLELELTSKPLLFISVFFVASTVFRYFAGVDTQSGLMIAAEGFYLAAITLWYTTFLVDAKN